MTENIATKFLHLHFRFLLQVQDYNSSLILSMKC